MNTKMKDLYMTSDLPLASIISLFYPCTDIHNTADRRAKFVFEQSAGLLQLIEDAYAGRLSVEPFALLDAHKNLKRRLYAAA